MKLRKLKDFAINHSQTSNRNNQEDNRQRNKSKKYNPNRSANNLPIFSSKNSASKHKQILQPARKTLPLQGKDEEEQQSFQIDIIKRQMTPMEEVISPVKKSKHFKLQPHVVKKYIDQYLSNTSSPESIYNCSLQKELQTSIKRIQEDFEEFKNFIANEFKNQINFLESLLNQLFNQFQMHLTVKQKHILDVLSAKRLLKNFIKKSQQKIEELFTDSKLFHQKSSFKLYPISASMTERVRVENSPIHNHSITKQFRFNLTKSHHFQAKPRKQRKQSNEFNKFFSAVCKLKQEMKQLNKISESK